MLPDAVLSTLLEYLHETRMGAYVLLAQVNRATRRFFLSDYAWKKFDVHQVRGQHIVYTYKKYILEGIAAHYFNWLCTLPPDRRAWHMRESNPRLERFTELYDQMNVVASLHNYHFWAYQRAFYELIPNYDKMVWQCWLLHPHYPDSNHIWKIPCQYFKPFHEDRAMYSILAHHLCDPLEDYGNIGGRANPYSYDREFNLMLAQIGRLSICQKFCIDENFLLKSAERNWHQSYFKIVLYRFPGFFEKLYAQDPGAVFRLIAEDPHWLAHPQFRVLRVSEDFMLQCASKDPACLEIVKEAQDHDARIRAICGDI